MKFEPYTNKLSDFKTISDALEKEKNIVFQYSEDECGCMIVLLSDTPKSINKNPMPFGGNPAGCTYIAALRRGCMFFYDLRRGFKVAPGYITEKMNLTGTDANWMTNIINGLRRVFNDKENNK